MRQSKRKAIEAAWTRLAGLGLVDFARLGLFRHR
jgi:hypothetical protein